MAGVPTANEGKAMYHPLSWCAETLNEIPPALLARTKTEKPERLKSRIKLAEMHAVQDGVVGEFWAEH